MPVNHICVFFWDLTLPHCDFLATRTETKNYLNQGSGSFTFHGLESKPGSEGMMVNLDSASEKTRNGAPEQSHQNLIGLCFDLQIICMKLDISAEPRRYICRYRVMTLRCETFPSALIPPHHRTEQIKPGVFCSATLLSRNVVCFGATLSGLAPPFSLLSSLPSFLFIDSKISEEAANGDQKSSDMLASICCLTLSYTFFFILVFCSLSHSLKSSSALL